MWTSLSGIAGTLGSVQQAQQTNQSLSAAGQLTYNQIMQQYQASAQSQYNQAYYQQHGYSTSPFPTPDYTMCECNEVPDPDTQQTFYSFRIPLTEREEFFELNEILHMFNPDDYIMKNSVATSWGDSRLALFVFDDLLAVQLKLRYMGM
jgi:hypothetical protein